MSYEWRRDRQVASPCDGSIQGVSREYKLRYQRSLQPLCFFACFYLQFKYSSSSEEHRTVNQSEVSGPAGENSVRSTWNAAVSVRIYPLTVRMIASKVGIICECLKGYRRQFRRLEDLCKDDADAAEQ